METNQTHETEPLRSFPLCFVDYNTLSKKDEFVTVDSKSLGVMTGLKDNSNHTFYYWPDMTFDEVVVFKQLHVVRDEGKARMPVFHTVFMDPCANEDTKGRISVLVLLHDKCTNNIAINLKEQYW